MPLKAIPLLSLVLALNSAAAYAQTRACPAPWRGASAGGDDCLVEAMTINTWTNMLGQSFPVQANIRSGYVPENPEVPFNGNIIYYEGLGDSMLNHMPLFARLSHAGYRVIAFDYMGQGGSTGSMDDTRIYSIIEMGKYFWKKHGRELNHYPKKFVIGWSTGGLAAYAQATQAGSGAFVLLAPGLVPNWLVGEQRPSLWQFNMITPATLSTRSYTAPGAYDPHLEPIRPDSPFQALSFAVDLMQTAKQEQSRRVESGVKGLVFLSGPADTYVNVDETRRVLGRNAPHFKIEQFPAALHEIDNEVEAIGAKVREDILTFFESQPQY